MKMKSANKKQLIAMILLLTLFSIASFAQADTGKTVSRPEIDIVNQEIFDARACTHISDSLQEGLDSANLFIAQQSDAIKQGNKMMEAKDETTAFYKSQAEMRAKENDRLERRNRFWSTYAGIVTFIAGVSVMIILK